MRVREKLATEGLYLKLALYSSGSAARWIGRTAVAKVYVMEDGREHFASASMSGQDRMPQIKAMLHANPDTGANCIGSASQGQ